MSKNLITPLPSLDNNVRASYQSSDNMSLADSAVYQEHRIQMIEDRK